MPKCKGVHLIWENALIYCYADCIHGCDYGEGRVLETVKVLCIETAIHRYVKLKSLGDVDVIMMGPRYAADAHNKFTMFS